MIDIDLLAEPNQSLAVMLDGARFELTIKDAGNCMAIDVVRDNEVIVRGQRALCDYPVIPYPYLRGKFGNFIFISEEDEIPNWNHFGKTHFLCYVTAEEIAAIKV